MLHNDNGFVARHWLTRHGFKFVRTQTGRKIKIDKAKTKDVVEFAYQQGWKNKSNQRN